MRLIPLNDNVLSDLVKNGYSDFVLKSKINPGAATYFQEVPIEVYEAHQAPSGPSHVDLSVLKEHVHLGHTDCYVIIKD